MILNKYVAQTEGNPEITHWINTTLKKYLTKNPEDQSEIEHILDFMKSDRAPKRLQKMSYAQAKTSAEKWVKSLVKKGNHLDDTNEIEVVKSFKDGFKLVKLVGKIAFEREGHLMSHCVASYHGKDDVEIYSLRDAKNQPHCTIEVVKGEEINQIKGKGNGSIHPDYITTVLDILKHFKMDVKPHDMKNLGYVHLTPFEISLIKESKFKRTFFKYKKETYLFVGI